MFSHDFLADLIVVVHCVYVAFVVVGMALILIGIARRWQWVRNFWFRILHFLAVGFVAFESLGRMVCPLTDWERDLRVLAGGQGDPRSFVGRLVHGLIFYDAPAWVFTLCYCAFAAAVLATLWLAPPRWPWKRASGEPP